MKLLVDSDPGIDDALAFLYTAGCPDLEVVAVTTTFGNTDVGTATKNARWLMDITGIDAPLSRGAAHPLSGATPQFAPMVHGRFGFGDFRVPDQELRETNIAAPAAMKEAADSFGPELWIVALGPLTNVASALLTYPDLDLKIGGIAAMGGAFETPGNVTAVAEANIFNDPMAADIVSKARCPIRFVPLDTTNKLLLSASNANRLCMNGSRLTKFLKMIIEFYTEFYAQKGFDGGAGLHDPACVAAVRRPELFEWRNADIEVSLDGPTAGQTTATTGTNCSFAAFSNNEVVIEDVLSGIENLLSKLQTSEKNDNQ